MLNHLRDVCLRTMMFEGSLLATHIFCTCARSQDTRSTERWDGVSRRSGLADAPEQDHGDAARQADQDDAIAVVGLVGQRRPGEAHHEQRAEHPVERHRQRQLLPQVPAAQHAPQQLVLDLRSRLSASVVGVAEASTERAMPLITVCPMYTCVVVVATSRAGKHQILDAGKMLRNGLYNAELVRRGSGAADLGKDRPHHEPQADRDGQRRPVQLGHVERVLWEGAKHMIMLRSARKQRLQYAVAQLQRLSSLHGQLPHANAVCHSRGR